MATRCRGPIWSDHIQFGTTYSLAHLGPLIANYTLPAMAAKGKRPARAELELRLRVHFSHHCFARNLADVPGHTSEQIYEDLGRKEIRVFCDIRWELSKRLPGMFQNGNLQNCFHARKRNFFTVQLAPNGNPQDYCVYFDARAGTLVDVELDVQSAYLRSDAPQLTHPKISYNAILWNAARGMHAHAPP
jgi:hypothetical protein